MAIFVVGWAGFLTTLTAKKYEVSGTGIVGPTQTDHNVGVSSSQTRHWCSGIIVAFQAVVPGSIPG